MPVHWQADSFTVIVGTLDHAIRVRAFADASWTALGLAPSRFWEVVVDLSGYQAVAHLAVSMQANAPGVEPANTATSTPAYHTFVPATAASHLSEFHCNTTLAPGSSARRDYRVACRVRMLDANGDAVKGVVDLFRVVPSVGEVTGMTPSSDGWFAEFEYVPPRHGRIATLAVQMLGSHQHVANSPLSIDIVDFPTAVSTLSCTSAAVPATTILAGTYAICFITPRTDLFGAGERGIKAIPADFTVQTSVIGGYAANVSPLQVMDGGSSIRFSVTPPSFVNASGMWLPVHAVNIRVSVTDLASGQIRNGNVTLDVAHVPARGATTVTCSRVERADPGAGSLASIATIRVAAYESAQCVIAGAAEHMSGGHSFRAKTLSSYFQVSADSGQVSSLVPTDGGHQLTFWCVPSPGGGGG